MQQGQDEEFDIPCLRFASHSEPSLPDKDVSPYLNIEPPNSYELFEDKEEQEGLLAGEEPRTGNPVQARTNSDFNLGIYLNTTSKTGYDQQTRQQKLQRYRQKKSKRIWRKKVAYTCRQNVANHRPRVRGRFVSSKNPPTSPASPTSPPLREIGTNETLTHPAAPPL